MTNCNRLQLRPGKICARKMCFGDTMATNLKVPTFEDFYRKKKRSTPV